MLQRKPERRCSDLGAWWLEETVVKEEYSQVLNHDSSYWSELVWVSLQRRAEVARGQNWSRVFTQTIKPRGRITSGGAESVEVR